MGAMTMSIVFQDKYERITTLGDCAGRIIAQVIEGADYFGFRFKAGTYFYAEGVAEGAGLDCQAEIPVDLAVELGLIEDVDTAARRARKVRLLGLSEQFNALRDEMTAKGEL
jgi:hypothetical protein